MKNNRLGLDNSAPDIVLLTMAGTFGADSISALKEWALRVQKAIADKHGRNNAKIKVLIDIRDLEGYTDPETLTVLADLMEVDNPHVKKTASFGGTKLHELAQDVIKAFAGRDNLKNFKTEEEARAWLNKN